jgi:hypothetical protein
MVSSFVQSWLKYSNIPAVLQQGKKLVQNENNLSCASSSLFFYGQLLCVKLAKIFQYSRCSADQEKREDRLWVSFHLPGDG